MDLLRKIVDSLPISIYWKDSDGMILGCNKVQANILGYERPESLIGKTDFNLYGFEKARDIRQNDLSVIESGEKNIFEELIDTKAGTLIMLSTKKRIEYSRGEFGVIGISSDIKEKRLSDTVNQKNTELKAALAISERARDKHEQFLENQQHDIITPLAGIVSFSDILKTETDMESIHEFAGYISESGHQMYEYNTSLLRDLEWMKDRGRIVHQRFDILETIQSVFSMNFATAKSKDLEYNLELDTEIPQFLLGDRLHVYQTLLNLLSNAVHFTEKGCVSLHVKLLERDDKSLKLRFCVADTGIGISENHQRYIFDEFYKVMASNKSSEDKGRGLGLTLAQKYAKGMGGELYLSHSEIGKGSEFRLTLPFDIAFDQHI